jgi:hypothetical protein
VSKIDSPFPPVPDLPQWSGQLSEISGLIDLRLFAEAWGRLEELPDSVQLSNLAARARVPCLLAFGQVELALRFANILKLGDQEDRLVAASAFVAVAVRAYERRKRRQGWRLLESAIKARPDLQYEILKDPRLPKRLV